MHVACRFLALPVTTHINCFIVELRHVQSVLYLVLVPWGGLITDLEPLFFVQHTSLDTLVSNLSSCFLGCFLLFLTEIWRCRHFVATCGSSFETKLLRRGPTRPFALLHVHTVELSHLLVTFSYAATIFQGPARFLTRIHTTTTNRSFPQAGDTMHRYATEHTAAPQAAHTLRPVFPKRVHYNVIQMVQYIVPISTPNLPHQLAGI